MVSVDDAMYRAVRHLGTLQVVRVGESTPELVLQLWDPSDREVDRVLERHGYLRAGEWVRRTGAVVAAVIRI